MKKLNLTLTILLVFGIVLLGSQIIYAQQGQQGQQRNNRQGDRPQFDPQQMMERMIKQVIERLKLSEEESAVIKPQIENLMKMRTDQSQGMRDLLDKLQKAIDAKDTDQIKTALTAVKAKRAENKSAIEKAEKELTELLTLEQEATLTVLGIVNSDGMGMGFRGGPGGPGGNNQRQGNQGSQQAPPAPPDRPE